MGFKLTKVYLEEVFDAIELKDVSWFEMNMFGLHVADIAAIIDELAENEAAYVYGILDDDTQSEVLMELEESTRDLLISSFSSKEIAEQIENLDSDDATDIISELSKDQIEEIISHIQDGEVADDIVDLLKYAEDTAGGLMQKEFIKAKADWPVNRCIVELRKQAEDVEQVYTIYVVDDSDKLLGYLSLKRLLFASPLTKIGDLYADKNIISVKTSDDDEYVAKIMEKYDLVSVPVIDIQGKLVGRITIDDVLDVIIEEAEKDLQMASGISEKIESSSTVWRMSRARLPWLLIGLLGGILGAQVISGFEGGIEHIPALAFFIPLITAMGGNVGVQSSAIVVQSLARGDDQFGSILKKIRKEAWVAIINGLLLSLIAFAFAFLFKDAILGFVVSLSLFTVIMFAAVFGTLIPIILDRYKIDPALATGPFITTLNDVLGLFIYFTIGMLLYSI